MQLIKSHMKNVLDFDPQVGDIWPLEQVHMLGREQNPSPQLFLQIAVESTTGKCVNNKRGAARKSGLHANGEGERVFTLKS